MSASCTVDRPGYEPAAVPLAEEFAGPEARAAGHERYTIGRLPGFFHPDTVRPAG